MAAILTLGFLIVCLATWIWTWGWVFGPLQRAAKNVASAHGGTRFQCTLGDLFSLVALVALPNAYLSVAWRQVGLNPPPVPSGAVCSTLFVIVYWAAGVLFMSRGGMRSFWRRMLFLMFVFPLGSVGTLVLPFGIAGAVAALFPEAQSADRAFSLFLAFASVVAAGGAGLATRWLVRGEAAIQDGSQSLPTDIPSATGDAPAVGPRP